LCQPVHLPAAKSIKQHHPNLAVQVQQQLRKVNRTQVATTPTSTT
jgi:hypothetical protein